MPAFKFREAWSSGQQTDAVTVTGSKETYQYHGKAVAGSDDIDVCRVEFKTFAADVTAAGLVVQSHEVKRVVAGLFFCTATYGVPNDPESQPDPQENDELRSFSTSGKTGRVFVAIDQQSYAPAGEQAPDVGKSIGDNGEQVEGVDIIVPGLELTYTKHQPMALVTDAWVKARAAQTGTVNDADFRGYEAGELLFLGMEGQSNADGTLVECVYHFEASQNRDNIVREGITIATKKGHEYIWFRHRQKADDVAHARVAELAAAYVAQVYETSDFSQLAINPAP